MQSVPKQTIDACSVKQHKHFIAAFILLVNQHLKSGNVTLFLVKKPSPPLPGADAVSVFIGSEKALTCSIPFRRGSL